MSNCVEPEEARSVEVTDGVILLLGLVCVPDVMAGVENEGSLTTLEDVDRWIVVISMVNATTDNVCDKVGSELTVLDSTGFCRTVVGKKDEKLVNTIFVEVIETIEEARLLDSTELCRVVAGDDAGDDSIVDCNTGSDIAVGVVLIDSILLDVATGRTAELDKEDADGSMVEDAIDWTVEFSEKVMGISWVEVAIDCSVEVVDGITESGEVVRVVRSAIVDEVEIIEDDVGIALVGIVTLRDVAKTLDKTVATGDGVGTALEERLSALMMSAAFARVLALCSNQQNYILIPSPLLHIRQPVSVQLGSLERFLHQQLEDSAYLLNSGSQHGFFSARIRSFKTTWRICFPTQFRMIKGENCATYPKHVDASPQHRRAQVGALPMCRWGGTPCVFRY